MATESKAKQMLENPEETRDEIAKRIEKQGLVRGVGSSWSHFTDGLPSLGRLLMIAGAAIGLRHVLIAAGLGSWTALMLTLVTLVVVLKIARRVR